MLELAVLPLAQMNTSVGGAGSAPAGGGGAPVEQPVAGGGGGAAVTGGGAATGAGGGAVTTAPGGPTTATKPANPPSILDGLGTFAPIILMIVVLYFFMFRGQRKESKRRKELINELKKGDRVMTIGGMIARVVSIDGDEVVLKIDESANVKATYSKKAIQEVMDRDEKK